MVAGWAGQDCETSNFAKVRFIVSSSNGLGGGSKVSSVCQNNFAALLSPHLYSPLITVNFIVSNQGGQQQPTLQVHPTARIQS